MASTGRRPRMLKDFLLREDSNSCSSPDSNLLEEPHPASRTLAPARPPAKLQRSRSRSRVAAEAAVSALQKLLDAVKPPSRKKKKKKKNAEIVVRVRVKDILRWTSLRDLIDGHDEEEKTQPSDCISASPSVRPGLDDRAGPFYVVGGESLLNAEEVGEKANVGGADPTMAGAGTALYSDHVGPSKSEHFPDEDHHEQQSPISVLDSPFRDDPDSVSSFDQTLANVERTKERLLDSIKWFESLAGVKPSNSDEDENDPAEEPTEEEEEEEEEEELLLMDEHKTKSLSLRELEGIEECVGDVEKQAQWIKFEEQQKHLGFELEVGMLNALLDELLFNLVGGSDGLNY